MPLTIKIEAYDSLNASDCKLLLEALGIATEITLTNFTEKSSVRDLVEYLSIKWLIFQTIQDNKVILIPLCYPLFSLRLFPAKNSGKMLTIMHPYVLGDLPESAIVDDELTLYYEFNARNITGIVIKDWISLTKYQNKVDSSYKPSLRLNKLFKPVNSLLKRVYLPPETLSNTLTDDFKPFLFQYFE